MAAYPLAAAFRSALQHGRAVEIPDAETESLLREALARAHAAWPEAWLDPLTLVRALARAATDDASPCDAVRDACVEDLYLALACGAGRRDAIEALEQRYFVDIDAAIRQRWRGVEWANDFKQTLREKLYVGSDSRAPRILDYAGHGPLRAWLRVIVLRDLINQQTRGPLEQPVDQDELVEIGTAPQDLELRIFKQRYAPEFENAFKTALAALEPRERQLLQQRFVDGQTLEQLAVSHRVDRATVVRWLAKVRGIVLADVRHRLVVSTRLPASEISSLLRHVRSDLQATLTQLLG